MAIVVGGLRDYGKCDGTEIWKSGHAVSFMDMGWVCLGRTYI